MKKLTSVLTVLPFIATFACVTPPPHRPFQISESEFRAEVHKIALAALVLPDGVADPDAVREKFERLITRELREDGFEVVPSGEVEAIWHEMSQQLEGLFDPMTGKRDEEKHDLARKHTLSELRTRFNADALLHSGIYVVEAQFNDYQAQWCRTSQGIKSAGIWILEALAGTTTHGTLPALCLRVTIEDLSGTDLYRDEGGIQVLQKVSFGGFQEVAPHELFLDEERNRQAVDLALDSLAIDVAAGAER